MNILFLDTASKNPLLALCTEEKAILLQELPKHGDSELVPLMEAALKKAHFSYADLTHLACIIGPGGFTSLRIGVTAINTLAYALGLPSVGIHVCDLWERRVKEKEEGGREKEIKNDFAENSSTLSLLPSPFLWIHSTRRTQLFTKKYKPDGTSTPIELLELEAAKQLSGHYLGELLPEHQEVLSQCIKIPEEELHPIETILPSFLGSLTYEKGVIQPWYGREG